MTSVSAIDRRVFLQGSGLVLAAPALIGSLGPAWGQGDPFSLGVASGDSLPDGFVIWTRLAPAPLSSDPNTPGGMSGGDRIIDFEIAADSGMRQIVRRGKALAEAIYAYSVHKVVRGLEPGRPYWYRFTSGAASSRIGRAMTMPKAGASVDRLRFAYVSCSNYELGYFSAYRHLREEAPDFVIFLGDYIYETVQPEGMTVRRHFDGVVPKDLADYRHRYEQYRLDPDLQDMHAAVPAFMTWDDHEVENDYADRWGPDFADPKVFLKRRAAAYRAFYEHMPLKPQLSLPHGPDMRVYDRFGFGDLAQFSLLDGRQYRSREACWARPDHGGAHQETDVHCPERLDSDRSMLGMRQEAWLYDGFAKSTARWNVIAQDVLMAHFREHDRSGEVAYWTDDWNGYPAARARLMRHIHDSKLANPVVLSGDIHSFWSNDLHLDADDEGSPVVASEFVGTSVTSNGPPEKLFGDFVKDNPHVHFFEARKRGYVSVDVTKERMTTRFQALSDVRDPKATVSTLKSFVIEDGQRGAVAV
ncbi:MAG TPA: alkaline phosphatase D family protein [Stellaceae bacterium]|nr:alkaline phosphatase D family protein [Stellaceae bacterium]